MEERFGLTAAQVRSKKNQLKKTAQLKKEAQFSKTNNGNTMDTSLFSSVVNNDTINKSISNGAVNYSNAVSNNNVNNNVVCNVDLDCVVNDTGSVDSTNPKKRKAETVRIITFAWFTYDFV